MQIVAGAPVTGADFFKERQSSVQDLKTRLKKNDVLVTGPRRTGKTSVVMEYQRQEQADGKFIILIDLEKIQSIYEYYFAVTNSILTECQKWRQIAGVTVDLLKTTSNKFAEIFPDGIDFGSIFGVPGSLPARIKIPKFSHEDDARNFEKLASNLNHILKSIDHELIIFLDEFPELIWKFGKSEPLADQHRVRKTQTQFLLEGLRALRQEQSYRKHKIIVAGSINLTNTLKHLGLTNTINAIDRLEIPYLIPKSSAELVDALTAPNCFTLWSKPEFNAFVEKQFGYCSPFYLQLFSERMIQHVLNRGGNKNFTLANVQLCYKETLSSDRGPAYFRERLKKYYDPHSKAAEHILSTVAKTQFEENRYPSEQEVFDKLATTNKMEWSAFTELLAQMLCDDIVAHIGDGSTLGFESQFLCNFWHYSLVGSEYLKS